ncbi:hypothetical protein BC830DRAFT_1216511 [Chytriomyces sp. MP71]|nr:hypothetical protein BC830DRAFT_1216511 [Chytriomyces sp. MP71]
MNFAVTYQIVVIALGTVLNSWILLSMAMRRPGSTINPGGGTRMNSMNRTLFVVISSCLLWCICVFLQAISVNPPVTAFLSSASIALLFSANVCLALERFHTLHNSVNALKKKHFMIVAASMIIVTAILWASLVMRPSRTGLHPPFNLGDKTPITSQTPFLIWAFTVLAAYVGSLSALLLLYANCYKQGRKILAVISDKLDTCPFDSAEHFVRDDAAKADRTLLRNCIFMSIGAFLFYVPSFLLILWVVAALCWDIGIPEDAFVELSALLSIREIKLTLRKGEKQDGLILAVPLSSPLKLAPDSPLNPEGLERVECVEKRRVPHECEGGAHGFEPRNNLRPHEVQARMLDARVLKNRKINAHGRIDAAEADPCGIRLALEKYKECEDVEGGVDKDNQIHSCAIEGMLKPRYHETSYQARVADGEGNIGRNLIGDNSIIIIIEGSYTQYQQGDGCEPMLIP